MMRKSTFKERVSDSEFCRHWQSAVNVRELAGMLGVSENVAKIRACQLRRLGRPLKKFPPVSRGPRRQPAPRPKMRSTSEIDFQPSRFRTELEFDEALAAVSNPNPSTDGELLADLTDEIYRRAAAIREARPSRATIEDRKRPVEVAVVECSEHLQQRR